MDRMLTCEDVWPIIESQFKSTIGDLPVTSMSLKLRLTRGEIRLHQFVAGRKIPKVRVVKLTETQVNKLIKDLKKIVHIPNGCLKIELDISQDSVPMLTYSVVPQKKKERGNE